MTVQNKAHRLAIQKHHNRTGVTVTNPFFEVAYRKGCEWLVALMAYLQNTCDAIIAFIHLYLPTIKVISPQDNYLLCLDFRKLNLDDAILNSFFIQDSKLGLSPDAMLGRGGERFMRMNIGTTKANVLAVLRLLKCGLT